MSIGNRVYSNGAFISAFKEVKIGVIVIWRPWLKLSKVTLILIIGLFICFYTYIGYGIVVWLWLKIRNRGARALKNVTNIEEWPEVTLLIAAYNEEDILGEKVRNCFSLDYPEDRLKILFITDGSNDDSARILAEYPSIQHRHHPERRGKIAAVKRAMKLVTSPFVVFTDANTFLSRDSIKLLMRHFKDDSIGAVAGEKRVSGQGEKKANTSGEGLYWQYESFLKKQDAQLYSVVGAAGELYAIRSDLFQNLPTDTILDDFEQTLKIAQIGYRVGYEAKACAEEEASANLQEELKRKIRICAGGFQAMSRLTPLLNPFKFGVLSFQYISHRVLRWTLAPLSLPLIFFSNLFLVYQSAGVWFKVLFALQFLFYSLALWGYLWQNKQVKIKGFFVPLYFCIMNYAVYLGFFRFLRNKQSVNWEKAKRRNQVVND